MENINCFHFFPFCPPFTPLFTCCLGKSLSLFILETGARPIWIKVSLTVKVLFFLIWELPWASQHLSLWRRHHGISWDLPDAEENTKWASQPCDSYMTDHTINSPFLSLTLTQGLHHTSFSNHTAGLDTTGMPKSFIHSSEQAFPPEPEASSWTSFSVRHLPPDGT